MYTTYTISTSIAFYITASQPHPHTWCTYKMMVGLVILYLIKWCSELCHTHTSHILTIVTDLVSDSIFIPDVQLMCQPPPRGKRVIHDPPFDCRYFSILVGGTLIINLLLLGGWYTKYATKYVPFQLLHHLDHIVDSESCSIEIHNII